MTLSAVYLSKLLGVTIKTIDMYMCGWGFSHVQTTFKNDEKYYEFLTEKDLIALEKLAKRRRRKCKQ